MHWLRSLFGLGASNADGDAASAPSSAIPSAGPIASRANELAEFCRGHIERGHASDDLDDWEWRKRRNPEWTSLTSEELAAISPDPTALDRAEHERLIEKWQDDQQARGMDPTPSSAQSAADLAAYCRSSFVRERIDEERAFKEWKAGYRECAADLMSEL